MRLILVAISLLIVRGFDCLAQGINNPLDDVHNPIGALKRGMERRRLMQYAGIAEQENERLRAAGQARINAGQASTSFQRTIGPPLAPPGMARKPPIPPIGNRGRTHMPRALLFSSVSRRQTRSTATMLPTVWVWPLPSRTGSTLKGNSLHQSSAEASRKRQGKTFCRTRSFNRIATRTGSLSLNGTA